MLQASSQLGTVVRAEIQARMDAVAKLTQENAAEHEALRAGAARAEQKCGLVLEAQRALNGKHDALRGEHEAAAAAAAQGLAALRADTERDTAAAAERTASAVAEVREALAAKATELETQCQVRPVPVGSWRACSCWCRAWPQAALRAGGHCGPRGGHAPEADADVGRVDERP